MEFSIGSMSGRQGASTGILGTFKAPNDGVKLFGACTFTNERMIACYYPNFLDLLLVCVVFSLLASPDSTCR